MKTGLKKTKSGFSLIEMVIYIAIMALILVVVVNTLSVMILSQKKIKNHRVIEHSSSVALERLTREIKSSKRIDFDQSVFGSNPGRLVLEVENLIGESREIEFFVEDSILKFRDGELVAPLIDSRATIGSFLLYSLSEDGAQAVRIALTIEAGSGEFAKTETFYASALMRN
ncbi:MAG: prepilin-type N-terminal cleavage/methylation domain-containing protein [Candidatus Paceibacterota bacterium]|nr:MAG: prepilin-type N-terminal cleavage/methylation domain-containing protein [Candidatus Paceibacterota bacterium]